MTKDPGKSKDSQSQGPKRGPGKPFVKGDPRAGRPKGVGNLATIEVKELAGQLVKDAVYQANLLVRLRDGTLPPAVEVMLWHYHWGKPKESVELTGPGGRPLGGPQVMLYMPDNGRAIAAPSRADEGEVADAEVSPQGGEPIANGETSGAGPQTAT